MEIFVKCLTLGLCLSFLASCTQQSDQVKLGRLQMGATVSFVRDIKGEWGIEISGKTLSPITQQKPVQIKVFRGVENVSDIASGYQFVQKEDDILIAKAMVSGGNDVVFNVEDRWSISGNMLSLHREVNVTGTEENAGFYSAIRISAGPTLKWEDADFLAPGLLYGKPHTGASASGGSLNYNAKRFSIREDVMSAPLFGILLQDCNWLAVLNPAPDGATTLEETTAQATTNIIDERIQFGALGANEVPSGGIEIGFWLPGTTNEFNRSFGMSRETTANPIIRHRYHPIKDGFSQSYHVGFRFGKSQSFLEMEREAWRWAWQSLDGSESS